MQKRSLIKVFLLSVITCGIYQLYWLIMTRRDMIRLKAPVPPSILVPFVPLVFGVVSMLSAFTVYSNGRSDIPAALVVLLGAFSACSFLAWIALSISWAWQYSRCVEYVTDRHLTQTVTFWLWILAGLFNAGFLWFLLVQHEYNNTATRPKHKKAPKKAVPSEPTEKTTADM